MRQSLLKGFAFTPFFLLMAMSSSIPEVTSGAESQNKIIELSRAESGPIKKAANITISFGSYGSGTNRLYSKKIETYISGSKEIKKAYLFYWGKEGEHTYFLNTQKEVFVFNELKKILPLKSKTGFIEVSSKTGVSLMIENFNHKQH